MELATGAMAALLPKLVELLKEEYKLQAGVRKDVEFLGREMRSIDAALRKVAMAPHDQLDEQVMIWADHVRELSYEMEDVVDRFLVGGSAEPLPAADPESFWGFMNKLVSLFKRSKTCHQIARAIKDMKNQVHEVAARRDRYKVDDVTNRAATATIDPRMLALFKDKREFVGIEEPRDELIKRLAGREDGVSNSKQQKLKILSIFGFGGLGKTTLAKAVYDKLTVGFIHRAFVSVGQNPDVKKVLVDILLQLDASSCLNVAMLDQWQLIRKLRGLIEDKRYLIVIDDIWSVKSWEIIRCAWVDSGCGSVIITTTRILEVAEETGHVYKHMPLSRDHSKELFYKRLSIGTCEDTCDQSVEISEKILEKCGGVPLAILTIASLLAGKTIDDWSKVYNSIGFGHQENIHVDNTRKILLFSYYDLPFHLRTCLLYLCIFPEDSKINKDTLIWKWAAEGFILQKSGMGLFASGETYFNELINRSMILPVERPHWGTVYACRVHDLVLDMILSLSKEENFVTVFYSNEQCTSSQSKARRLAIQNSDCRRAAYPSLANIHMQQVRSFNATTSHLGMMPSLSSFQALRVLALEGCTFMDHSYHLEHLGRLLQLRYLGMSDIPITELPTKIGDLKFLQTLNLTETEITELPQSVGLLGQLKCLNFDGTVSDWIGCLTSLEKLSVDEVSLSSLKQLGKLTELREFNARLEEFNDEVFKDLMEAIGNMQRLEAMEVNLIRSWTFGWSIKWPSCEGYVLPRDLRVLELCGVVFPRLPAWINSSGLQCLSHLRLRLEVVEVQDIETLGRLPELITLNLCRTCNSDVPVYADDRQIMCGGALFPKLKHLSTNTPLRLLHGDMPSLECFVYWLEPPGVHCDLISTGSLPCLEQVTVFAKCDSASSFFEEATVTFTHALEEHPNNPALSLSTYR